VNCVLLAAPSGASALPRRVECCLRHTHAPGAATPFSETARGRLWTANGRARFRFLVHAHRRARRLTRAGLDVGEALVKRLGENGRLDPSYACLATDADCSVRTVQRACDAMRGLGLLRWMRRLVRNGPYVEQTSNAYELTPAGAAPPLPSGSTRIGDGQKGRRTNFVDTTYCSRPHEIAAAQAALARARARMEQRLLRNGCRMLPAT
jgi:hypothetical protein